MQGRRLTVSLLPLQTNPELMEVLLPLPASPMHVQPILFVPLAVRSLWTFGSFLRVLQTTHSANFRHESEKRERTSEKRSAELGLRPAAY